mgnify:CR=1 FL=1
MPRRARPDRQLERRKAESGGQSQLPTAVELVYDNFHALVFAFGGFESALIPAAETKNPRRDAPFAP